MSALWIKICGMTTPEAVAEALAQKVDAIGFVFAESPRQVTAARAVELAAPARGRVQCIAVTRHPTQSSVDEIVSAFKPDALQTDIEDLAQLRLPRTLGLLPVVREGNPLPPRFPERLLYEGQASGTGVPFDWSAARDVAHRTQLVLAGGLNPDNVGGAIAGIHPFGVDVSSGVEQRRGIKSPEKIARFVRAVRASRQDTIP